MKIYEIGTGYTSIPAQMGAATEIIVEELTRSFLKLNKDVQIIDIADKNRAETDLPITEVKVPSIFTKADLSLGILHKLKRVVYSVFLALKLIGILKKAEEKVVLHFHNQYNMFFYLLLVPEKYRKNAVTVYTNHNGYWTLPWDEAEPVLRKRYFQEIECMKKADIVLVLNEQTKDNAVKYLNIDENRIVRVNNGVNTDIYKPLSNSEINKIKEKYNLKDKKIILQVGSVYENKGQKRMVEALIPLLTKKDDLVYAYVGGIVDEEYKNEIDILVDENGLNEKVVYLGMAKPGEELNGFYNMAESSVFASGYEGFPLVIPESLSAGTPVIISLEREMDMGDGSVDCEISGMCEIVEKVIEHPEAVTKISAEARQNALDNYTWDKIAENHLKVFADF
jgi:glycosyltransferase involved in cell wall biosynthesis